MRLPIPFFWSALLLALSAGSACAQPTAQPAPLPTALHYESPLAGYQAYAEPPAPGWRQANEHVGRIGGWRAYAREAQLPAPASAPAQAPTAPDPHAGHGGRAPGTKP